MMATQSTGYGMFGPSPEEVQQQRMASIQQQGDAFGQMDRTARADSMLYQGAAGLGDAIGGAMGYQNPAVTRAKKIQDIVSQHDQSSPEGMTQIALALRNAGLNNEAAFASQKVREYQVAAAENARKTQADELALRKQNFAEKEAFDLKTRQIEAAIRQRDEVIANKAASDAERVAAMRERTQLASMVASMKSDKPAAKPKGLTREAGLKWEFENGAIDQVTYDAAISASPGGKLRQSQSDAVGSAESGFSAIERNIAKLTDPSTGELSKDTTPLFGKYAQLRPDMTLSQGSIDAKLALDSLTDQVMMTNLADAKTRVGQSFGSMQVQEWDKFTQQLTSLKRGQSKESAAIALKDVLDFIKNKRAILKKAMSTDNAIKSDRSGKQPMSATEFDAMWNAASAGTTLIGPDGKSYTKK
jgi:hypothetical protein